MCFVDVSLIFSCPANHVPNWQPRGYYWVWFEARSVTVHAVRQISVTYRYEKRFPFTNTRRVFPSPVASFTLQEELYTAQSSRF